MTCTTIRSEGEKVYICRFIDRKLYKIGFNKLTPMSEVVDYFTISNELFIKCAR